MTPRGRNSPGSGRDGGIARDDFMLGSAMGLLVDELTDQKARQNVSRKKVR
ncbi:hypothetical protein BLSMQ_1927 [Brevibacterium aurantiacum]|uniref:Uncharacterized protein n=1 Tax=Brevibacterium aurantiacum TaxID=273384 RepID=A0A1D7W3J0_BREAU|nr:hypothetical protein BLSMQ_1927 [Brevibacterium aurantiacum]